MRRFFVFLFLIALPLFADNLTDLSAKADNYAGKYPYVYLYQKTYTKVKESGASVVVGETAVKILSEQGAKKFYSVSMFYDPLTAEIKVLDAYVLRKDGKKEKVELSKVKKYPQPARWIYWPNVRVSIPFGLLNKGDVIVYKTEKRGFSYALLEGSSPNSSKFEPPMKGEFYDIVDFQAFVPILYKRYSLELPKNKNIQYRYYKGEVSPYSEFTDYGIKYVFEKKDIPAIDREPHMPALSDVSQKLLVSTTRSWKEKSEWFYKINENFAFNVTPEIKRKVEEILKGAKTEEEKIDRLNHWVAHYIRYSGLSMGEGEGFTLHPAEMTFRDRQGVCKDKAGMLITFLRAAGFEAYPAMTMAGAKIEDFPADFFNHCVVALKQKDGTFRMLDPTWVPWVREQWSSAEQEQQYLVGYKKGQTLETTPYSPPEKHFYKIKVKERISSNGKCVAEIYIQAEGQTDARFRRYMQGVSEHSAKNYFEKVVLKAFPQASVKKLNFTDPYDISQNMKVNIVLEIPDYAFGKEGKLYFNSLALKYSLSDFVNGFLNIDVSAKKRKYGIVSRCTKLVKIKEEILFDNKVDWEKSEIPENYSHKGKYADLICNFTKKREGLVFDSVLRLKKRVYPADAWNDLKKTIGEIQRLNKGFLKVVFGGKK